MSARPLALRAGIAAVLGGALALGLVAPANAAPVTSAVVTHHAAAKTVATKVTTAPKSLTVVAGKKATFKVSAKGTKLTYQWYVSKPGTTSFAKISGAKKSSYSVTTSSKLDGARYRAVVKGKKGKVTSKTAKLVVVSKPKLTTQPHDADVSTGKLVTFSSKATGHGIAYQWQVNATGSWKAIRGQTASSLKLTARSALDGNGYRVVVTNKAGAVASKAAALWVASSAADPYPAGHTAGLASWLVTAGKLVDITADAVAQGADVPADGYAYYAVDLTIANPTSQSANAANDIEPALTGTSGTAFEFIDEIGGESSQVPAGASVDFTMAFVGPKSDVAKAVVSIRDHSVDPAVVVAYFATK